MQLPKRTSPDPPISLLPSPLLNKKTNTPTVMLNSLLAILNSRKSMREIYSSASGSHGGESSFGMRLRPLSTSRSRSGGGSVLHLHHQPGTVSGERKVGLSFFVFVWWGLTWVGVDRGEQQHDAYGGAGDGVGGRGRDGVEGGCGYRACAVSPEETKRKKMSVRFRVHVCVCY